MVEERLIRKFISRSRWRLNGIVFAVQLVRWLTVAGGGMGFVVCVLRGVGFYQVTVGIWLLGMVTAGLIGLITGWRQRLDDGAAARWLDRNWSKEEVFAAAFYCLGRKQPGWFDDAVIATARQIVTTSPALPWPYRRIQRSLIALAGVMLFFTAVFWHGVPVFRLSPGNNLPTRESLTGSASKSKPGKLVLVLTPRLVAEQLFPTQPQLARQAEAAIIKGDNKALQELLDQANRATARKLAQTDNPNERRELQNEAQRRRDLASNIMKKQQKTNNANQPGQPGPTEEPPEPAQANDQGRDGKGNQSNDARKGTAQQGGNGAKSKGQTDPTDPAQDDRSGLGDGDTTAGSNKGRQQGNWGPVQARAAAQTPMIIQRKDGQVFEYVIPGQDARVPLARVVPSAQRTAEAAVKGQPVPVEYRDFIRSYFLKLIEATQSDAAKSGGAKQ